MKMRNLSILLVLLYGVLFAFMLNRSLDLEFNGELIALLPSENPHLDTYRELSRLNYSEGGFDAIISSDQGNSVLGTAREIADSVTALKGTGGEPLIKNAELENDLYDIKKSALYLLTPAELDSTYRSLQEEINRKKLEASPFYVELEEDTDTAGAPTLSAETSVLMEEIVDARRYRVNEDTTAIRVSFIPTFPKSDYADIEETYAKIRTFSESYRSANPEIGISWGGAYIDHYRKINDIQSAVFLALVIGTLSLILFLTGYMFFVNRGRGYRPGYILVDLFLAFFILFTGFVISLGLSSFIFNEINIFTGIIFSILFGINLDYILHVYSVNKQTGLGFSLGNLKRIAGAYIRTTRPILLSALTTGLAIVTLIFAEFEGFQQFGLIFFINIVVNLLATYLFLLFSPSSGTNIRTEASTLAPFAEWSMPDTFSGLPLAVRRALLGIVLVGAVIGGYAGFGTLGFNYSFSDLEPQSVRTEFDRMEDNLSSGPGYHEPSYFITETLRESDRLFHEIKEGIGTAYPDIDRVESFSARYPHTGRQLQEKQTKIDSLKQLVEQNREFLEEVTLGGDPLTELVRNSVPPEVDSLPKYVTNRFFFKNDRMAPMVIIYPAMSLSNGETSIAFRKSSGTVTLDGKEFHAASTSIIASSILEILIEESQFLFITPLLTIMVLLLVYYRSAGPAMIAVAPLILSFLILLAINGLIGFEINLYNVIVLPIVIGVGADNGIHLADAWLNRRDRFLDYFLKNKMPVLSACSITTVLGFIGMIFINHPGMVSLGSLAVISILTILLATLLTATGLATFRPRG